MGCITYPTPRLSQQNTRHAGFIRSQSCVAVRGHNRSPLSNNRPILPNNSRGGDLLLQLSRTPPTISTTAGHGRSAVLRTSKNVHDNQACSWHPLQQDSRRASRVLEANFFIRIPVERSFWATMEVQVETPFLQNAIQLIQYEGETSLPTIV